MECSQSSWSEEEGWSSPLGELTSPDLVLVFGGRDILQAGDRIGEVREAYPKVPLLGCSTAGEILGTRVSDDSLAVTAIRFDKTELRLEFAQVDPANSDSHAVGADLATRLLDDGLRHVFVLSDGLSVNGSLLVQGLRSILPAEVSLSGGLSADGDRFETTLLASSQEIEPNRVAALGLYGDAIEVASASLGGWDPFGPEREITRAEGNVLYELDGSSALELYKKYLGEHAEGLPATGLLFPVAVRLHDDEPPVVRTILGIDEEAGSMTFAGDLPEGALCRLMKANFERLVEGAASAAENSLEGFAVEEADLAILISCVGRKMVLKQRVEEEVEAVAEVLGSKASLTGFYSYGEISPFTPDARCELHNQTMTVTVISER